jgi:lipoate-protein ligase A
VRHEVKLDHVRANGIGLVRRITGGGAIYLDEGQLGWELVFSRRSLPLGGLGDYAQAICRAVAGGLSMAFGIDARFRPRNDIEVGGRKLSGTGGFFDGDTLIYQGTVLIDMDPAAMMACLNVPQAKLAKRGLESAGDRVVTLKQLLGSTPAVADVQAAVVDGLARGLGLEPQPGVITEGEETAARAAYDEEIGREAFVFEIDAPGGADVLSASVSASGGAIAAHVRLEGDAAPRIREVLITGDFFITPPRLIYDLEATLRGVPAGEAAAAVMGFFAEARPDMLSIAPGDIAAAVAAAIADRGGTGTGSGAAA